MRIIKSMLDNDLYSYSMQQAVLQLYPDVMVEYEFTDRAPQGKMGERFHSELREEIEAMRDLRLSSDELDYLSALPFLKADYLAYLRNYRFNPDHIHTSVKDGRLTWRSSGKWVEDILWEVPTLAIISEVYFRQPENQDGWDADRLMDYVSHSTDAKGMRLNGLRFADFGTRRRRSFDVHDTVVKSLKKYDTFHGTSNVYLAMRHGVKPIGTMSHQWIMGISAIEGHIRANSRALTKWNDVYQGNLGIALTDTFGTSAFWKDFDGQLARLYDGIRHDSGCPYKFTDDAIAHYKSLGIYAPGKTVVYSDGLDTELCLKIADYVNSKPVKDRVSVAFGIGTNLTNCIPGSPALKIVIKLRSANGSQVVKLSDEPAKATGDKDALRVAKYIFFNTPLDDIK